MAPPLRIERLTLEKYGPFEDRVLEFRPDASLHLVLGRNEAGKSVTLRALTDLFCGFPDRIDSEDVRTLRFKRNDLRLGASLLNADGRQLSFRRRPGKSNALLGARDGETFDEARLREFAGSPVRQEFEAEFGLTAQALRSGGESLLAAGGRLAETLAAGSSQLAGLNVIRATLQAESADLFMSSGRSRKLNGAVERYQTAGKELRAAIVTGDALKRARDVLEAAEAQRAATAERLAEIERRRALLLRAQRTRAKLRERASCIGRLEEFSGLPEIDESSLASWQAAFERETQLDAKIAEAQSELAALQAEAAQLHTAPDLLTQAGEIEKLREMLGAADKSRADLPRREESANSGAQKLERAAQALDLPSAAALIERMPQELALVRVRDLLKKQSELTRSREGAVARLEKAVARRRGLEQSGPQSIEDPAPLLRAFEGFADIPAFAKRLHQQAAEIDEETARLEREAQRLAPSVPFEQLLRLPLPDMAVIEKEVARAASVAEKFRQIDLEHAKVQKRIAEIETSLQALAREGEVASPEDMRAARMQRDQAVDQLEAEPEIDAGERGVRFAGLRRSIAEADRQADVLLGGADRAARRAQLRDSLADAGKEKGSLDALRTENAAQQSRFDSDWRALWSDCGFAPLSPEMMRDWRNRVQTLIDHHDSLTSRRVSFAAAKTEFTDLAQALTLFATRLGISAMVGDAPLLLHGRIRDAIAAQQKAFTEGRTHEANLANAGHDIAEAEKEIAALNEKSEALAPGWSDALGILALGPDAGAAEAEAGLALWTAAIADLRQFREDEHRVKAIGQDIEAFELRVADLCARFCPEIAGESPRRIVEALGKRLETARTAAASLEHFAAQQKRLTGELETLLREQSAARDTLAAAMAALNPGEKGLQVALERLSARDRARQEIGSLTRDIASLGDGLSTEQLESEQQGIDFDGISAEIATLDAQKQIVLSDVGSAAIAQAEAAKALAALEEGRDAIAHANEREEAAAELLNIASDWLVRMGAARLAGIAMERHRQRHQDPVIAATARHFATVTGGAFEGVVIDYDSGDQPVLKGLRANGERVALEAMSEGTRDQLFLSLRLAILAQRSVEPLPFIGDDLLASFDDTRTAHALDMLADFGASRQPILFTHHRHVADIARDRLGARLDVIEIG
jgi:chromosome segregation protein